MGKDYRSIFRRIKAILEEHNSNMVVEDLEQMDAQGTQKVLWIKFDPGSLTIDVHNTLCKIGNQYSVVLIAFRVGSSDYRHYVPKMDAFYRIGKAVPTDPSSYDDITQYRIMKRDLEKEIKKLNAQHIKRSNKRS